MLRSLTLIALAMLITRIVWVVTRPKVEDSRDGPVTIEMSVWGMPWENDLYKDIYIPEFEALNPGIKVKFHHFEDYGNKVKLTFAGDIAPDVMRMGNEGGPEWIKHGIALPLDKY